MFPTSIIIITICFPAPWRKCNATGAEDDDDDVDVVGVDGDDEGVIYYYCCDYYSLLHCPKIEGRGREGVQFSF